MNIITRKPKGTEDTVPAEDYKWKTIETVASETAARFGFRKIGFPTFEHTELFIRSVGDTTDVVQKEMYTFLDKGGRSITLRPEGTAGTARAVLENGLLNDALPLKTFYFTTCFRYEKPQSGRLREHHQFGVEMFGPPSPLADAELISLPWSILEQLGIQGLVLKINSIGCPQCRKEYQKALVEYLNSVKGELCDTCLSRLERNPLRTLDCKVPHCGELTNAAPRINEYLCEECKDHFQRLTACLDDLGITYDIDTKLVRGLDYYTRTVFEIVTMVTGSPLTVCAGGRYDGLIEELGGPKTPALGFGMGLERLLMVMDACGASYMEQPRCDLYLAPMGEKALKTVTKLVSELRAEGFWAETDLVGRSLKAQMRYADKIKVKFTMVLGDNELETGVAKLKDMDTGEAAEITLGEGFLDAFSNMHITKTFRLEEIESEE